MKNFTYYRPAEAKEVKVVGAGPDAHDEPARHGAGARFLVELPAFVR